MARSFALRSRGTEVPKSLGWLLCVVFFRHFEGHQGRDQRDLNSWAALLHASCAPEGVGEAGSINININLLINIEDVPWLLLC